MLIPFVLYLVKVKGYGDEWLPILRMYRGVFLLVMMIFLVAINTCGWRAAGVNHVLIFELNPRTHLTYQQVLEVGILRIFESSPCFALSPSYSCRRIWHCVGVICVVMSAFSSK